MEAHCFRDFDAFVSSVGDGDSVTLLQDATPRG